MLNGAKSKIKEVKVGPGRRPHSCAFYLKTAVELKIDCAATSIGLGERCAIDCMTDCRVQINKVNNV